MGHVIHALLCFIFFLVVTNVLKTVKAGDIYLEEGYPCHSSSYPCETASSLEEALMSVTDGETTIYIRPGSYDITTYWPEGDVTRISLVGVSGNAEDVVLHGCIPRPVTFSFQLSSLTLVARNESCVLVQSEDELILERVQLYATADTGIQVENGDLYTTDVTFSNCTFAAVLLSGTSWISEGFVRIEGYNRDASASRHSAILLKQDSVWRSNGPVIATGNRELVILLNSSKWESTNSVLFEHNDNTVWMIQGSIWEQSGPVSFVQNHGTAYPLEDEVNGEHYIVVLQSSTWISKALVSFKNNTMEAEDSGFVLLKDNATVQSSYIMLSDSGDQILFWCESSKLYVPLENRARVIRCDYFVLPLLEWDINTTATLYQSFFGGNAFLLTQRNVTLHILRKGTPLSQQQLNASVFVGGAGGDFITVERATITIPFAESAAEFFFQLKSSSVLPFTLSIEPIAFVGEEDLFAIGENGQLAFITAAASSLPALTILFPFPRPDFVCFPPVGEEEDAELFAVLAKMKRIVEWEENNNEPVDSRTQDLTALVWTQSEFSPTGEVIFSANITFAGVEEAAFVQVTFTAVAKGSTVELEDGETVQFEEDGIKWNLSISNWPWADSNNVLVLETSLRTGAEQWLSVEEETTPSEDEGGDVQQWRLEGEYSSTLLRILLWSWVDGQLDAPQPVQVEVVLMQEDQAEVEVKFILPHFQTEILYDPDLSVLVNGEGGDGGEDGEGEDGGEDDGLWWKITVPSVVVAVVALAAGAAVTVVLVQKRNARSVNQHKAVNY